MIQVNVNVIRRGGGDGDVERVPIVRLSTVNKNPWTFIYSKSVNKQQFSLVHIHQYFLCNLQRSKSPMISIIYKRTKPNPTNLTNANLQRCAKNTTIRFESATVPKKLSLQKSSSNIAWTYSRNSNALMLVMKWTRMITYSVRICGQRILELSRRAVWGRFEEGVKSKEAGVEER